MVLIKIDRDMLIEELFHLRAEIPVEAEEAKKRLMQLVLLVQNAPADTHDSLFPRISTRRRG